jgi:hypothetical protein
MKRILSIIFTLGSLLVFSQNKETKTILSEGKLLYRLEKASWFGTDDMPDRFKNKKDSIGGYLSYETSDYKINTIFFSRYNSNKILIRYQFDSLPKQNPIIIDTINKNVTKIERNLIGIRQNAKDIVNKNSGKYFNFYENTSLNFIPIIRNGKKQVFVLTGPQVGGIVLLGNDYLLKYDNKYMFKSKEKLHNSIIQFSYKSDNKDNSVVSTMHSHVVTDYITSTDICTLLLYKDYVEWKQHIVLSKKQVSIFDLDKETLFTMKRKAWEKIYSNQ